MSAPVVLQKVDNENCFKKINIVYIHRIKQGEFADRNVQRTEEIKLNNCEIK